MMKIPVLLNLSFIFLFFTGAHLARITFTNNCPYTVWPATLTADQKPQLATTGFELQTKGNYFVDTPVPWIGRFWARTDCHNDNSEKFTCAPPGDCGTGQVMCNGNGGQTPATLAEFTIAEGGGQDFYDVSLVDGFNLPVSVTPRNGHGDCRSSSCRSDVNANCTSELQVKSSGKVVGCKSACAAFNETQFCCTYPNNSTETCPPTKYSMMFSQQCPEAYSYAFDDKKGTFTCFGGPNYTITFCPL